VTATTIQVRDGPGRSLSNQAGGNGCGAARPTEPFPGLRLSRHVPFAAVRDRRPELQDGDEPLTERPSAPVARTLQQHFRLSLEADDRLTGDAMSSPAVQPMRAGMCCAALAATAGLRAGIRAGPPVFSRSVAIIETALMFFASQVLETITQDPHA